MKMIEATLESFGIKGRVAKVNILPKYYEYYIEVAVGTELKRLENLEREIAMAVESPTGKVKWQLPVPGTFYAGLKVPKPDESYFKREELEVETSLHNRSWKSRAAFAFFLLGEACHNIARRIMGIENIKPQALKPHDNFKHK
jgi:DNA segregation ATPase FtsK/SpoIIIE, S-DNA-T family